MLPASLRFGQPAVERTHDYRILLAHGEWLARLQATGLRPLFALSGKDPGHE